MSATVKKLTTESGVQLDPKRLALARSKELLQQNGANGSRMIDSARNCGVPPALAAGCCFKPPLSGLWHFSRKGS
jgi:hypothetical protein